MSKEWESAVAHKFLLRPYDSANELKESVSLDDWSDSNGESRRRYFPALSSPEILDIFGVAFFLDSSM